MGWDEAVALALAMDAANERNADDILRCLASPGAASSRECVGHEAGLLFTAIDEMELAGEGFSGLVFREAPGRPVGPFVEAALTALTEQARTTGVDGWRAAATLCSAMSEICEAGVDSSILRRAASFYQEERGSERINLAGALACKAGVSDAVTAALTRSDSEGVTSKAWLVRDALGSLAALEFEAAVELDAAECGRRLGRIERHAGGGPYCRLGGHGGARLGCRAAAGGSSAGWSRWGKGVRGIRGTGQVREVGGRGTRSVLGPGSRRWYWDGYAGSGSVPRVGRVSKWPEGGEPAWIGGCRDARGRFSTAWHSSGSEFSGARNPSMLWEPGRKGQRANRPRPCLLVAAQGRARRSDVSTARGGTGSDRIRDGRLIQKTGLPAACAQVHGSCAGMIGCVRALSVRGRAMALPVCGCLSACLSRRGRRRPVTHRVRQRRRAGGSCRFYDAARWDGGAK